MATFVGYGGTTVPALQAGHPNLLYLRFLEPAFCGQAPSYYTPVPVAVQLKGGITGIAYSETVSAQGGTAPYGFIVTSGSLPSGTTLTAPTGVIAGTPTVVGTFSFTIRVADTNGFTGSQAFSITIAAPFAANYGYTA